MHYRKKKLSNGLRLITVPMKETQTATVLVMVGVGSRYEKEREAGLSHFIEHMLFKGTSKRPTALDITSELDAIGGEFNAFTSKDSTGYYVKVDAKHLDTALDVVADIYLNAKIEEAEIEKEKGAILQEIAMIEDTPLRQVGDLLEELLYRGNPLGRDIIGFRETVNKMKRKDFLSYLRRFYLANDTVVCVAGKFDQKKISGQIGKYFSRMERGRKPRHLPVRDSQSGPQLKIKFKNTDQTHFILGCRAYRSDHKDRFVLGVLSVILGGNMSSRLFIEVREKRGLAYYVRTGVDAYDDCGYLGTQAGVEHRNLALAIKTILEEYRKIASDPVGDNELRKAKDFIKGRMAMGMESSDEVASFFVEQELKRKKILSLEEVFRGVEKVTAADIRRVAREIFQTKKMNLAVIGPHRNAAAARKALTI